MTHRAIIVCDKCGSKHESTPGKLYPEGWGTVRAKQVHYNEAEAPIGVAVDYDLCDWCYAIVANAIVADT